MSNQPDQPSPTTPQPIRLRWSSFKDGKESTNGHFYLRWVTEKAIWRFSFWEASTASYLSEEGTDPKDGGKVFLGLAQQTYDAYIRFENQNLAAGRAVLRPLAPDARLAQRGFRPVTASQYWRNMIGGVHRNHTHTSTAVACALTKLRVHGWAEDTLCFNFATIDTSTPWKNYVT